MTGAHRSRLAGLAVVLSLVGGVTIACARTESGEGQPATGRFAPSGWTYLVAEVEETGSTAPTRATLAAVATVVGAKLDPTISDYRTRLRPPRVEFAIPPDAELPPEMTSPVALTPNAEDGYIELRPVSDAVPAPDGACPLDEANPLDDGKQFCDVDGTELFTLEPSLLGPYSTVDSASASEATEGTGWVVDVELDDTKAATLAEWTAARIGERLAIVHDGVVLAAPTVETELSGSVQIVADFTEEEAALLAAHLHLGAVGAYWQLTSSGDNPAD